MRIWRVQSSFLVDSELCFFFRGKCKSGTQSCAEETLAEGRRGDGCLKGGILLWIKPPLTLHHSNDVLKSKTRFALPFEYAPFTSAIDFPNRGEFSTPIGAAGFT